MNGNKPPLLFKVMMSCLYLIQGMFYGYVYSLPLSYKKIPSYKILSIFAASAIPFSFKFVLAPVVERYHFREYGKRKTWIVLTILLCSVLMFFMGNYAESQSQSDQKMTAILLFLCVCCVAIKDIAADGLAVQTLEASQISMMTFLGDQIGKLITLPLFLTCISADFLEGFRIKGQLISVSRYIHATALFGLTFVCFTHFWLDEGRIVQNMLISEQQQEQKIQRSQLNISFGRIFAHYKKFITITFRICRMSLLLILINQGMQIFAESYPVELVKSGISRQKLSMSQNLCLVPNIIVSYVINYFINSSNYLKFYYISTILKYLFIAVLFWIDFQIQSIVIAMYVLFYIVGSVHYYLQNVVLNEESRGELAGLSITLMLSLSNLSRLTVLQKLAMDSYGYGRVVKVCLIYGVLLVVVLPKMGEWATRGISLRRHTKKE